MRSVNLIPKRAALLTDWESSLLDHFDVVQSEHSDGLARREGHPAGAPNKLRIEEGPEHVFLLDRPTTIREYAEEELRAIEEFTEARQFFAVDFTDKSLLVRVLRVLLQREGPRSVLVEDEESAFVLLEDFIGAG